MGCAVPPTCRRRDPDAWTHADGRAYYNVSSPVPASTQLVQQLLAACSDQVRRQQQRQRTGSCVWSVAAPQQHAFGMQPAVQARLPQPTTASACSAHLADRPTLRLSAVQSM